MVTVLEQTETLRKLDNVIENCIAEINENGGFEVLWWYSHGEINNRSLIALNAQEEQTQAGSGKVKYLIV